MQKWHYSPEVQLISEIALHPFNLNYLTNFLFNSKWFWNTKMINKSLQEMIAKNGTYNCWNFLSCWLMHQLPSSNKTQWQSIMAFTSFLLIKHTIKSAIFHFPLGLNLFGTNYWINTKQARKGMQFFFFFYVMKVKTPPTKNGMFQPCFF